MTVLDYYKVVDKKLEIDFCDEKDNLIGSTKSPGIVDFLKNYEIIKITRTYFSEIKIVLKDFSGKEEDYQPFEKKALEKIKEILIQRGEEDFMNNLLTYGIKEIASRVLKNYSYEQIRRMSRESLIKKCSGKALNYILENLEVDLFESIPYIAKINIGWPTFEEDVKYE